MSKAVLVYGIGISGCGAADILARQGKRVLLYNDAGHEVDADLKEYKHQLLKDFSDEEIDLVYSMLQKISDNTKK